MEFLSVGNLRSWWLNFLLFIEKYFSFFLIFFGWSPQWKEWRFFLNPIHTLPSFPSGQGPARELGGQPRHLCREPHRPRGVDKGFSRRVNPPPQVMNKLFASLFKFHSKVVSPFPGRGVPWPPGSSRKKFDFFFENLFWPYLGSPRIPPPLQVEGVPRTLGGWVPPLGVKKDAWPATPAGRPEVICLASPSGQEAKECHLNAFRDRYLRGMPTRQREREGNACVVLFPWIWTFFKRCKYGSRGH